MVNFRSFGCDSDCCGGCRPPVGKKIYIGGEKIYKNGFTTFGTFGNYTSVSSSNFFKT